MSEMFGEFQKGRKHDPEPRKAGEVKHSGKKKRVQKKRGNAVSVGLVQFALIIVGIICTGISATFLGWFIYQAILAYTG